MDLISPKAQAFDFIVRLKAERFHIERKLDISFNNTEKILFIKTKKESNPRGVPR